MGKIDRINKRGGRNDKDNKQKLDNSSISRFPQSVSVSLDIHSLSSLSLFPSVSLCLLTLKIRMHNNTVSGQFLHTLHYTICFIILYIFIFFVFNSYF